ncbi:MAG: DM13 domain-containing protein [Chloroflexi bacterium]|nr:DM13 domain-containing protein [Chloroflexota bacterium]
MTIVVGFFSGHPRRLAAALVAVVLGLSLAWYLGSPLFLRTYTNEALPSAAPVVTATASAAGVGASIPSAPTAAVAKTLGSGQLGFVDSIHNGKGEVRIVALGTQRLVRFENVAITNAPDIHVYLSRETGGKWTESTSLYLGALKATNGSFNYEIPAGMDVSTYKSVVVWCRNFSVLITWADLRAT